MKTVLLFSGGLDSTVMLYALRQRETVLPVAFDYGQLHACELNAARRLAENLEVIRLPRLRRPTPDIPNVDPDHQAASLMVFPNRNMLMLAAAASYALQQGANRIAAAFHADDAAAFPDCRESFVRAFRTALYAAVTPSLIDVEASFLGMQKHQIVQLGAKLAVPFGETWSCYRAADVHCGECPACRGRRQAFAKAGVADPTVYLV